MNHIHSDQELVTALENAGDKLVVIMCSAFDPTGVHTFYKACTRLTVEYPDVTFLHVDVDEMEDYCKDVNVVPTFKFYKNGKEVFVYGGINLGQIKGNVDKLKWSHIHFLS